MEATEDDEVFHWGREVDVKWGMLTWVTFRDQASLNPHLTVQCNEITDNAATFANGPRSTVGMGRSSIISIINVPPLRPVSRITRWEG